MYLSFFIPGGFAAAPGVLFFQKIMHSVFLIVIILLLYLKEIVSVVSFSGVPLNFRTINLPFFLSNHFTITFFIFLYLVLSAGEAAPARFYGLFV